MVALSHIRHNFEMPIDAIVYSRKGGCFVTYRRSAAIVTFLLLLIISVGFIAFRIAQHLQQPNCPESLLHFIESSASNGENTIASTIQVADVSVKNYRLSMQPVFNRSTDSSPFTTYGTVWITFTPSRDRMQSIPMQIAAGLQVPENSVYLYRSRIWNEASFETENDRADGLHRVGDDEDAVATSELLLEDGVVSATDVEIEATEVLDIGTNQTDETITYDGSASHNRLTRQFTEIAVTSVDFDPLQNAVRIQLALPLKQGHFYVVKLSFAGSMSASSGFTWTGYENGILGGTLGESGGPLAFPWIRTADKVTFDMDIRRPVTMKSVATARLFRTQPVDPDNVIDVYRRSAPMNLDEFAFALHELHTIQVQTATSTAVSVLLRPMLAARNQTMIQLAIPEVMQRFERLTGLRSDRMLRIVLVPKIRASWRREANGLIFLSEKFILSDLVDRWAESTTHLGRFVFTNILRPIFEVTPVNWFEVVLPLYTNPNEELNVEQRMRAMRMDADYSRGTLNNCPSRSPDNIEVIQSKALGLLKAIERLISEEKLTAALREYIESRLDGRNRNIIDIIQRSIDNMTTNTEFVQLVNMWLSFEQYPILSVGTNLTSNQFTIKAISPEQDWIGPVEFITSHLNDSEPRWTIFKRHPTAYFRVNYEQSNWLAILLAIERNDPQITAFERASIADDVFSLARSGLVNYTLVMRLIDVWTAGQMSFIEWKPVVDNLQMLLEAATESENFPVFNQYVLDEITITFRQMHQSPLHANSKLKTLITSLACCTMSIHECRPLMQLEFAKLLAKTDNLTTSSAIQVLDLSETYTTLCATLKLSTLWSKWSVIRDAIGRIDDAPFNRMLIQTLSCSEQPQMQRALVGLLNHSTMFVYRANIYSAASRNPIARLLVLEHLLAMATIDRTELDDLTPFWHSLSSQLEFQLLQTWFERIGGHQDPSYWSAIVSGIRDRIAWRTRLQQQLPPIAML